jgi:acetolactate synthase-1/2/3 large subunit
MTGAGARTGGEWVVEALRAEGVTHVFGIPGIHNLAVYDALLQQREIAHVLTRHEAGAAFMADGYARASGRIGVVLVTTGPGATNTLTPLVESYAGSVPVLVVMSDVAAGLLGREVGALHEVPNQIECFRPVTRLAEVVTRGGDIPAAIRRAFTLFRTGRPGPVALSIPNDLLAARAEAGVDSPPPRRPPACDRSALAEAARLLGGARRPILIAGGGVIGAGAEAELEALARRLGAPVVTTVMGRGAVAEDDPLWLGVLPNKRATETALRRADVILAVGCRFAHRSTQGLLLNLDFRPDQALIHLDLDRAVLGKLFEPRLGIVGDAKDGLARLAALLGAASPAAAWETSWLAAQRSAASARYTPEIAGFMTTLRRALPPEAIVVNDQTGINYWMEWRFPVARSRTFLYPVGSAVLGYAVPAAIGAQIAHLSRPVVAVVGDGGFMFSVAELATAVKYRLPVVFLVMNDDRYGAIKWLQEAIFGKWGEAELTNPDFPALARAFGARGERLTSLDALPRALAAALRADGPTVLELRMTVDPPWEL